MRLSRMVSAAVAGILFSLACADGTSPVKPVPPPQGRTEPTFSLQGDVGDTASRPLKDASVTVINGDECASSDNQLTLVRRQQ